MSEEVLAPSVPTAVATPDAAKSPEGLCELPSGYLDGDGILHKDAVVKELTGEEEDILTSKRYPAWMKLQKVLENCVTSIGTINAAGNREWSKLIKGLVATDRLHLVIHIRMVTLGNAFTFKTQCPQKDCEHIQEKVVDLADFKIGGMPDPMLRTWKGVLPKSNWTYTARVQTGFDEEKIAKANDAKQDSLSLGMLARLIDLNGVMPVTLGMLKQLGSMDRNFLRDDFKNHEGKLDNEVEVTCDDCGFDFKTSIEVADKSFFFPSGI